MKTLTLNIDGVEVKGLAVKNGTQMWVHLNGQTHVVELQSQRTLKQQNLHKDPLKIFAPMPGKVIKVLCANEDSVSENQTVVVMEAMKMEYALKAPIGAKVESLRCTVGQQVTLGELLVVLK